MSSTGPRPYAAVMESLGNKQTPGHLPPQAQLPLFVLDGHTRKSLLTHPPVGLFLWAKDATTSLPFLGYFSVIQKSTSVSSFPHYPERSTFIVNC